MRKGLQLEKKSVTAQVKKVYLICFIALFCIFTLFFLAHYFNQWAYITVFLALLLASFAVYFADRLKEMYLGKFVLKLYKNGEEGLLSSRVAMSIAQILIKLDEHTPGPASHRAEREAMINELLVSLKADEAVRSNMLENAKLITKLMATEDEAELDKVRAEIDAKGLFD